MGKKKHLQGISEEEMELINKKMSYVSPGLDSNIEYVDGYKKHLRGLGYKLNIK